MKKNESPDVKIKLLFGSKFTFAIDQGKAIVE